jgi:3-hydroxyacyl-[acyl-carrier-protein] dehydratase
MRNFMVDRILTFESGKRMTAIKGFARTEDYLDGSFPREDQVPRGILIEIVVQAASLFLGASRDFQIKAVPVLLEEFSFHRPVRAGSRLVFEEELLRWQESSAYIGVRGTVDGQDVLCARFLMGFDNADGSWAIPLGELTRSYFNALWRPGVDEDHA